MYPDIEDGENSEEFFGLSKVTYRAIRSPGSGDRYGLGAALRELAGATGDPGDGLAPAARDIGTLKINECGLSGEIGSRVRSLLEGPGGHTGGQPENAGTRAGKKRDLSHSHGEGLARQNPTYASL